MVLRTAIVEDLATLEQIHRALKSGAKPYFLLRDNEIAIRHLCKVVDDFIQAGLLDCNCPSLLRMYHVPLLERTKQA